MIKGLYIHIPFCKRICSYCDFNKRVSNNNLMKDYKDALIKEMKYNASLLKNVETIYIGGGTPSFYPYIEDILKELNSLIDLSQIKEFTIESTIESIDNLYNLINKYYINRISIGIETFNKESLEYINRPIYDFDLIENKIEILRKLGVNNINLDLISGLPFETYKSLKRNLYFIKKLNIDHISYYDLIVEDKTKLKYDLNNGTIKLQDEDTLYKFSKLINKKLKLYGFNRYEFSNYSKKNKESIHNLIYWNLEDYIGIGVNSHSFIDGQRKYNTENLKDYLKNPIGSNIKENTDIEKEYFLMGLRKTKGISISKYESLFKMNMFIKYTFINQYIKKGLLKIRGDYLSFTKRGIEVSNIFYREFV